MYIVIIFPVLVGMSSLAVDIGHVEVVKLELRRAATAAAQYGALGLATSPATAKNYAALAAADNTVDGTSVTLVTSSDVQLGSWNSATKMFAALSGIAQNSATAIKVTVPRTKARGNAVMLSMANLCGMQSFDVSATCVVLFHAAVSTTYVVQANYDPYLAGEPNGTNASYDDYAGPGHGVNCSPVVVSGINLDAGSTLSFQFNGAVTNGPSYQSTGPDGNNGWILSHMQGDQNGISSITAPINAVVGIFLDDTQPDTHTAPAALDFTTSASRDYTSIAPVLRQPFFIGDGLTSSGAKQKITVPSGATRFYLCTMDGYEWCNDSGSYTTNVTSAASVAIVQ